MEDDCNFLQSFADAWRTPTSTPRAPTDRRSTLAWARPGTSGTPARLIARSGSAVIGKINMIKEPSAVRADIMCIYIICLPGAQDGPQEMERN